MLTTLTCAALLTGIMSSNAFAASINDSPDDMPNEKVSQSEIFYSNDNYNLNIDIQNTASDFFVSWGASISQSDTGYIKVQGSTESYMNVSTIGYTLHQHLLLCC